MHYLYWTRIEELPSPDLWELYLGKLPYPLAQRLMKYPTAQDRYHSLCGKLLLQTGLRQLNRTPENNYLSKLRYQQKGRPYLTDDLTDFNLSHSSELVVCAITEQGRLGVDVQKVIPIPPQLAQLFLSEHEWDTISRTLTNEQIIKLWTNKEAIAKLTGNGLSLSFNSLSSYGKQCLVVDETLIYTQDINLESNYACSMASDCKIQDVIISHVPINELLPNVKVHQ